MRRLCSICAIENQSKPRDIMEQSMKQQGKIGAFFDKNYALFFAPVIVAFAYILALVQNNVYPFGSKYTAASYDLSAQICPFIEHLFDVFDGKSTLTFSYAIVGGADVTGTFLYFFISPFSFLFLMFGDGKVAEASSIVMLCKLMAISVAGTWFAKKLFQNIPDYLCIAVGVTYAYCGYTFVANTYINWVDFLIYLPFCVGAFRRFLQTDKFLPFALLSACCIYTCFSIACFALFTVYPALVGYALLCEEKGKRKLLIARISLAFVVAILLALPVLLPALKAYSTSGREGTLFENLWKGFSANADGSLGAFTSSTFVDSYVESLYRKWSYIFSDSVFVALTLVWFFRKGLKDKFAKFMLFAGGLTLLPLLVDESMNLLNMGSYMSYALRFGFLNAVYFLGGACLCIDGWCYQPFSSYDGEKLLFYPESGSRQENSVSETKEGGRVATKQIFRKENRRILVYSGILIALGVIAFAFLLWFTSNKNYVTLLKQFGSDSGGFAGSFAHSLGGLEVVIFPCILVALLTFLGCCWIARKKISPRLLSFILLAVVGAQIVFYNGSLVVGNRSTQHARLREYQTITERLNEREEGYFRVKDYNDSMTAVAPFTAGSNSFSVFSSVIDKDNFELFQLFGYSGNGKNTFKSAHNKDKSNRNDVFGDAFMGYRYFVSTEKDLHEQDYYEKYVQPVYEADEQGEQTHLRRGSLYVYENTAVFPLAYKASGEGFRYVAENVGNATNRKNNQFALYAYLKGEAISGSSITAAQVKDLQADLQARAADLQVGAGTMTAKVTASAGESLLLPFVAAEGYSVEVNGKKTTLIDNDLKLLQVGLEEGENVVTFTYRSPYIRLAGMGAGFALLALFFVALVVKKTKLVERLAPVVGWAGIAVGVGVVVFFMIFPTGVFLSKVVWYLKGLL